MSNKETLEKRKEEILTKLKELADEKGMTLEEAFIESEEARTWTQWHRSVHVLHMRLGAICSLLEKESV